MSSQRQPDSRSVKNASRADTRQDPSIYQYRATRDLVNMVNQAADLYAKHGRKVFRLFLRRGSRWLRGNRYIFIYDLNGVCLFHPITPEHVGKNRMSSTDVTGKPVHRWIVEVAGRKIRPYGWIHYHRPPPYGLFPLWKSTYIVGVRNPSGKKVALSSGLYNMRLEKRFIIDLVDRAADLIERDGNKAFPRLTDQAGPYVFAHTYVYVMTPEGDMKVDPAFPHGPGRNALNFKDATGKLFIRDMLRRIKGRKTAWSMYMWPKPGEVSPSKKLMYVRRVQVNRVTYLVGSDLFLASPIWLR